MRRFRETPFLTLARNGLGDCTTHMTRPSVTPARASSEFLKGIPESGSESNMYIHHRSSKQRSLGDLLTTWFHLQAPTAMFATKLEPPHN